ncbi:MAG: F0F1 ATP synthase subunit delta [Bacteroidales bacterium]|nr:F0F1 ATP synthase subunit delta [Bacteroidales bacterium]
MNDGKISVRYAKALLSSASDQGKLDQVRNDMEAVLQILREVPELKHLLHSPVIEPSKKEAILVEVFKGKVDSLTLSFFRMIVKNKREEFLPSMARMYLEFFKEEKGIKSVTVTTAVPIDQEIRSSLVKLIEDAYRAIIELGENVDKKLIGGFILKIEDVQLDASVAGQLKRIKQELLSTPLVKTDKK